MTKTLTKSRVGTNLTEGPVMKTLLVFAGPIILTNLIQQLYSMVDLMVIGKFVGTTGTVGVNTGGEIADLIMPIAMGFSSAGQIYIAQLSGAKEESKIKQTVGTLISFMLLIALVLAAGTILFHRQILMLLNCPSEAMGQASAYMLITALGMPFIFGYNAVCGVLRGMGESKSPLKFILVAASVNIILDLLLVIVFPLEAAGTAIATVVSQIGAFLAAFLYLWKRRKRFDFELKISYFKIQTHILVVLVKLGIPQVVRGLLVRVSMLWINASANSYGITVSATNSVGNKLQKFLEVYIQGLETAAAAMIGQNLGAKKSDRAGKVSHCTLAAAMSIATVISLLCIICPRAIFGIFSSDPEILDLGEKFLHIMIIHFYATAAVASYQSMVTGCGFVSLGFAIGVLDGVICKIGLSIFFATVIGMGYMGLFWGVGCSRILPAILCAIYYYSGKWRTRKLLTEE